MIDKDNKINADGSHNTINYHVEDRSSSNMIHYIAEPALFITLITSCLYFVGNLYYLSFFSRLSIQTRFINIRTADYMTVAFLPIVLLGIFIAISYSVGSHVPKNRLEAFLGNLVFMVTMGFNILLMRKLINNNLFISIFTFLILLWILVIIYLSYKKWSFSHSYHSGNFYLKFCIIFIILSGILNLAMFLGDTQATNLIQGNVDRLEIQLFLKDKMNTQLQDKTFIFIMLQDNKYYIIDKNQTSSKYSKLYIIPTDEVEMATVYTNFSKSNWFSFLN